MSTYTDNNVNYLYTVGSGIATVITSSSASGTISILDKFTVDTVEYNVTSISDNAFNNCTGLTSVTIPSSITSIGINAFTVCTGLTSITIPSSVTSIGNYAFAGCTGLTNIIVNAYLSNLGIAFFNVNNIGLHFTFDYIGAIPDGVCNGRNKMTSITIGPNITSIGSAAFKNCSSLASITIPSSLTSISTDAFSKCTGLITVNNTPIADLENTIYSISISNNNNTIIFNGYLYVYKFINLINFFYNNADIIPTNLLAYTSNNYGADYTFGNGNFSYNGTAIVSIPSLDQQYGAQEWFIWFDGTNHFLSYKNSQNSWVDLSEPYTVTSNIYTPSFPPSTPTITSVSSYNQTATINFTQTSSDNTITNYAYSYSINGGSTFTDFTLYSPATTTSPLTITGLTNGSVISYRIRSYNDILYSSNSNTIYNQFMYTSEPIVCFKDTTKILTNNGYRSIQDLKKGDLVETFGHGLKPITVIKKKEIIHELNQNKIPDQLYKYVRETSGYNELTEDLIITGRHAILVDNFVSETQKDNVRKFSGTIIKTDNKYHLPACVDDNSIVYEISGKHTVYNLALQSDNENSHYGIYANGLLVESCSEKYLKNIITMENIE